MTIRYLLFFLGACALSSQTPEAFSPDQFLAAHCLTCHGSASVGRAPTRATLHSLSPEVVYSAMTIGSMRPMTAGLTDGQRTAVAEALTEQKLGVAALADAKAMSNPCPSNPPLASPITVVNGYGTDLANSRFVPGNVAQISLEQVSHLKPKWAFGFPAVSEMLGQPTVASGRLFVGSQAGYVYSLNASTGCVYWSFQAAGSVRTAPVLGDSNGHATLWFGDLKANVYALDARTGGQIWKSSVDPHLAARMTAAPVLHAGVLYVPVSSNEEGLAIQATYECCTFRGSVAALDAATGRKLWQTYTIAKAPRPTTKNRAGTQLWGPAGGAVWGTPLVDPTGGALYIATGDSYVAPAPAGTDTVMALDLRTGAVLWSMQDLPQDAWNVSCLIGSNENCPASAGPDYDFGAATILRTLPNGKRVLMAAQKSGIVWAHDPDNHGAILWKTDVTRKKPDATGEIVWGGAADEQRVYYGLTSGGVVALDIATGEKKWLSPFNESGPHAGSPGAVTVIPGVVFSGSFDGILRALATGNGQILWQHDTKGEVHTQNGVKASGGSLGAPGPVVDNGMLYVESGYVGVINGQPGNVLLAFWNPSP